MPTWPQPQGQLTGVLPLCGGLLDTPWPFQLAYVAPPLMFEGTATMSLMLCLRDPDSFIPALNQVPLCV